MTMSQRMAIEVRKELLSQEVAKWATKGYIIEGSGETYAQLTIDPPMGCLGALFVLLTFGLARIIWRLFNQPHQVFITVDEHGNVAVHEKLPIYPMH